MPEFILNKPAPCWSTHLDEFTGGYLEACFFTNCDSGHEDETKANDLGVGRVLKTTRAAMIADCERFQVENKTALESVYEVGIIDAAAAGRDFWFTRQGHGVGFWEGVSRGYPDETGEQLDSASKGFGEIYLGIWRGWIG
jgi:hypothetical protein